MIYIYNVDGSEILHHFEVVKSGFQKHPKRFSRQGTKLTELDSDVASSPPAARLSSGGPVVPLGEA